MQIPVTLFYGGLTAAIVTALGLTVSLGRLSEKQGVGQTGSGRLTRKIRAHGNAAEWAPLGIVLLLILELSGLGSTQLHWLGGVLVASRLLHAAGLLLRAPTGAVGAGLTYLYTFAAAGWAIWLHFGQR